MLHVNKVVYIHGCFMLSFAIIYSYQINARTELAIRYNDVSPLENHHAAVAFQLLERVSEGEREEREGIRMVVVQILVLFLYFFCSLSTTSSHMLAKKTLND